MGSRDRELKADVLIVGSGLGAVGIALKLIEAGRSVLMLERGRWAHRDSDDWNPRKILIQSRYAGPVPLRVRQYQSPIFQPLPTNEVVGGMSVFYGGACFRFRERDFSTWPWDYSHFEPWYSEAERVLSVHGGAGDPNMPPRGSDYPFPAIEWSTPAERLYRSARSLGLHPFQIPISLNFTSSAAPLCQRCNRCDGYPCPVEAKTEASTVLKRLLQSGKLHVVTGLRVSHLTIDGNRVTGVVAVDSASKNRIHASGSIVVLSAGTLGTPPILLRSRLDRSQFPHAELIGRHLMRHCNGVMSYVFPFKTNPTQLFHKQLAITDFYEDHRDSDGKATGVIQDIYTPAPPVVHAYAPKGIKWIAARLSSYIQSLLCVAEDESQSGNRVFLGTELDAYGMEEVHIHHEYTPADLARRDYLMKRAARILKRAGGLIPRVMRIDSFSHAVGTVRLGSDERTSVLTPECRFRGLRNLFVSDGSVMPSSAGVNPSLTITANSLRVGSIIRDRFSELSR